MLTSPTSLVKESYYLQAFRDGEHKGAVAGRSWNVTLEGSVSRMALLDMSQLIWLHLRQGELGM